MPNNFLTSDTSYDFCNPDECKIGKSASDSISFVLLGTLYDSSSNIKLGCHYTYSSRVNTTSIEQCIYMSAAKNDKACEIFVGKLEKGIFDMDSKSKCDVFLSQEVPQKNYTNKESFTPKCQTDMYACNYYPYEAMADVKAIKIYIELSEDDLKR